MAFVHLSVEGHVGCPGALGCCGCAAALSGRRLPAVQLRKDFGTTPPPGPPDAAVFRDLRHPPVSP